MTKVDYKVQGVRGGNPQYKENVGYVSIFADNLTITADAFEGFGSDYKRREQTQITIQTNEDGILFEGSIDDLRKILKTSE